MRKVGRISELLAMSLLIGVPGAVSAQTSGQPKQLPDSPSTVVAQRLLQARLIEGQTSSTPSPPSQSQAPPAPAQKPVGTAAAETETPTGVAASNPAGAAIAPAKQRRVRMLFIEVGAIVGAGVALGTVAALESASPSKPPGSR